MSLGIPRKQRGDVVDHADINRIVDRVNSLSRITGSNGVTVRVTDNGVTISGERGQRLSREPARLASVVNTGSSDIKAFAPAGIDGSFYESEPDSTTTRLIEVSTPEPRHAGRFVIAAEPIAQGYTGFAWIGGVCVARLVRWFDSRTPIAGFPLMERADILSGQDYLLAHPCGAVDVLWEASADADGEDIAGEAEHFAVVRFDGGGARTADWYNDGGSAVALGCPVKMKGATGVSANKRLSMELASDDADYMTVINAGGSVAAGEDGRAHVGMGPFLAQLDQAVDSMQPVGTRDSETTLCKGGVFYRVLAYLGQNVAGKYWAIVQRDSQPTLLKAISEPVADEVDVQTSSEEAVGSGVTMTLPIAWE